MSETDAAGPGTRTVVVRATNPLPVKPTVGAPALVTPTAKFPFASDVVETTVSPLIAMLAAPASVNASSARPAVDATGVGVGGGVGVGVGDDGVLDPVHDASARISGSTAALDAR